MFLRPPGGAAEGYFVGADNVQAVKMSTWGMKWF